MLKETTNLINEKVFNSQKNIWSMYIKSNNVFMEH